MFLYNFQDGFEDCFMGGGLYDGNGCKFYVAR